jgi:hypothetical protein
MRCGRIAWLAVAVFCSQHVAAQFVLFPKAGELASPDGRSSVRNAEREAAQSQFSGSFHSLWLTEPAAGRSQKLVDYFGLAAVAWSGNEFILVTEYLNKKTSRAMLFPTAHPENAVVIDKPTLLQAVPLELRPSLRDNDHVFVEASRVENGVLQLRVWGYGQHDSNNFRWHCEYSLLERTLGCAEQRGAP